MLGKITYLRRQWLKATGAGLATQAGPGGCPRGGPSQEGGGEQVAKGLVAAGGGWDGLRGGGQEHENVLFRQ